MEKRLYLPYAAMILSILLPYGVIEIHPDIGSPFQRWLFPFWTYSHGFSFGYSFRTVDFLFPFPWYEFPFVLLGLMWFVLGLSTSKLLHNLYLGRVQKRFFILLLLGALTSQIIMTYLMLKYVYIFTLEYVIPWPVHTLLVFSLAILYKNEK